MNVDVAMGALKQVQNAGVSFTGTLMKGNLFQVFVSDRSIPEDTLDKIANALPGLMVTAKDSTIEILAER